MAPPGANFTPLSSASLGFTSKACFFADKLKDKSISLNSGIFCNISLRPGDHAPFLETHGNSVRLGRSGLGGGALEFAKLRKGGLALAMQIMVALHVFASAGFQIDVGDTFGISKATMCRTVHRVANVLAGAVHRYVKFERRADAEVTKAKLYAMTGFPNVIGCIDCTHIRISGPHHNEHE